MLIICSQTILSLFTGHPPMAVYIYIQKSQISKEVVVVVVMWLARVRAGIGREYIKNNHMMRGG